VNALAKKLASISLLIVAFSALTGCAAGRVARIVDAESAKSLLKTHDVVARGEVAGASWEPQYSLSENLSPLAPAVPSNGWQVRATVRINQVVKGQWDRDRMILDGLDDPRMNEAQQSPPKSLVSLLSGPILVVFNRHASSEITDLVIADSSALQADDEGRWHPCRSYPMARYCRMQI